MAGEEVEEIGITALRIEADEAPTINQTMASLGSPVHSRCLQRWVPSGCITMDPKPFNFIGQLLTHPSPNKTPIAFTKKRYFLTIFLRALRTIRDL